MFLLLTKKDFIYCIFYRLFKKIENYKIFISNLRFIYNEKETFIFLYTIYLLC